MFQYVIWLPFVKVPVAGCMENQSHYSGNTKTGVGSHLCQCFSFFLPFYADRFEKRGRETEKEPV